MKTILKILAILMVAAIVAGGFYLLANNTSLASRRDRDGHQPPATTSADGQSFQLREFHDKGGEHGASLSRGLAGVAGTFVKLTVITIIVLLIQKAFNLPGNHKLKFAQR